MKAIIFGASKDDKKSYDAIKEEYEVIAYTDNDSGKWGGVY